MPPSVLTLPPEVTENVLLRLPAKSLVRFELVSSSWRSLISDPVFRKIHSNRTFQNPKLSARRVLLSTSTRLMLLDPLKSFRHGGGALVDLHSPLAGGEERRLRIVDSCNGLVCLGLADTDYRDLFIWNPSTGDCNKIPEPPTPIGEIENYALGFGYDSSCDDYKVVLITHCCDTKMDSQGDGARCSVFFYHMVAIYSLKINSWKIFKEFDDEILHYFLLWDPVYFPKSAFVSGAIHWRSRTRTDDETIIAFDVSKETFYTVPHPPLFMRLDDNGLGVLDGCLCLVRATNSDDISTIDLWVMKDYGVEASWTKLSPLRNPDPDDIVDWWSDDDSYEPLCASGYNTYILIRNAKELIRLNERGEIIENVCICDHLDKCEGVAFVESIVSVG